MSIAAFVAGVDRILSRAHELYPAGGEGESLPASGGAMVPGAPEGAGGLQSGVTQAAGSYQQARTGAAGLDQELQEAVGQGGEIGAQGRAASGVIRDQARAVAASTGLPAAPARRVRPNRSTHPRALRWTRFKAGRAWARTSPAGRRGRRGPSTPPLRPRR
uniref:hypothetical protein n=1 Tax=Mycobacterium avium TaxID=1764 RepID=UPI00155DA6ED|nr:hypothetical protein [Mycobacterium avium]